MPVRPRASHGLLACLVQGDKTDVDLAVVVLLEERNERTMIGGEWLFLAQDTYEVPCQDLKYRRRPNGARTGHHQ